MIKLTNISTRAIHHKDGVIEAGKTASVSQEIADLLLRLYPDEVNGVSSKKEDAIVKAEIVEDDIPLEKLSLKKLYERAKEADIAVPFGSKSTDIIALLEAAKTTEE